MFQSRIIKVIRKFDPDDPFMNHTRFINKSFASPRITLPTYIPRYLEKHSFLYDVFDKKWNLLKISRIFLLQALKSNGIKR